MNFSTSHRTSAKFSNPERLTLRQAKILAAIVKENCNNCQPVASIDILKKYDFELSSATIRNEMAVLEKKGYISQPYTSSGRVPTDKGFRFFVNQLMEKVQLSLTEQGVLKRELAKLQAVHMELGRRIVKLISEHSKAASFAVFPEETTPAGRQVSTMGISNVLNNPALPVEDAKEIAKFFDDLDSYAEKMIIDYSDEGAKTFIGKELNLSNKSDYSMIVSGLKLPSGKKGVIGLIGPKNMKYEKNLSLMEYISKLLGGSAVIIIFMMVV